MSRKPKPKTMADIVAEVEQEAIAADPHAHEHPYVRVAGRPFFAVDTALTPEETRDLAATSRLVIFDSCGCGPYCAAYELLEGRDVDTLVRAGLPSFLGGFAAAVEDEEGHAGVLLVAPARWGSLR